MAELLVDENGAAWRLNEEVNGQVTVTPAGLVTAGLGPAAERASVHEAYLEEV